RQHDRGKDGAEHLAGGWRLFAAVLHAASATSIRDRNQPVERPRGGARFDGAGGEGCPVQNIVDLAGHHGGGRGVQDGDVAQRRLFAGENLADGGGVGVLVAALEVGELGRSQAGIGRRYFEHRHLAIPEFGDVGGTRRGQLVEAVVTVHDP